MYLASFRCPVLLHLVSGTRMIKGQVCYILRTRYQVSHAQSCDTWYLVDSSTTSSAQVAGAVAYHDLVRLVPRTRWAGQETPYSVSRAYLLNDSDPLKIEHILVISQIRWSFQALQYENLPSWCRKKCLPLRSLNLSIFFIICLCCFF